MPENMSKPTKRKITVEPSVNKSKDSQRRPSVFERLGTKATTTSSSTNQTNNDNFCRHWAQNGNCQYGKNCKYANTHTLISPSKRAAKKEGDTKQKQGHISNSKVNNKDDVNKRLHSTVVVKKTHSPDLNWENWDQTDLEYEDEKMLEKRRQLLQRELELQMKREKEKQQRQKKDKKSKKGISSSSSTSASSSSSTESSSSSDDSSSTSSSTSGDSRRRKGKGKKSKRDSSSSASETDHVSKKKPNRSGKVAVKSASPTLAVKKAAVPRRPEESRPSNTKRREPSPRKTAPPPPTKQGAQPAARRRSLTPNGRSSSGHRRRSQTPPHKSKTSTASRSSLVTKQTGMKHNQSPRPNRSLSLDRKDKHNRSVSPRATGRDRDRDRDREREREREKEKEREREREKERDKEKEREREREKEKEREKEREREKEKEKEREREREREKEKEREKERIRSRSPKVKAKDRLSRSPRRNSRPPKDVRKKDSPDSGTSKDKGYRVSPAKSRGSTGGGRGRDSSHDSKRNVGKTSPRDTDRRDTRDSRDSWGKHNDARKDHERGREKDDDRKKDDRDTRRDVPDRGTRDVKDRGSRETTLERGSGGGRSLKDENSNRRDDSSSRKRESQMLPGIVEKTAQDRDYIPKGRDHGDNDRDRERDRGRDVRDIGRDNRDSRDVRDNRDARDGRGDGGSRDMKDGLDRNVGHDGRSTRESREAAREKEREEALERCRERQREREREKELNKAREYERELPSLLTMMTHKPINMQQTPSLLPSRSSGKGSGLDRGLDARSDRDRGSDRDRDRDRGLDRVSERDRGLDRGSERDRASDRDRGLDRGSDRDRGNTRGLDRDRGHSRDRDRERGVDRLSERDRGLDRSSDRDRPSDRDRGLDRNLGRGSERLDRNSERGLERGLARGSERTSERGLERSSERERVLDRGLDRVQLDRGLERGFDRSAERSYDRGSERSLDRGFDRGIERGSHLDREREREGRDNHSDRDYPLSSRSRDSDGRRPPPEDKGYDSPFEGRRGREERNRYSDQLDRNRYDDASSQREDPRSLVDRRLGVDPRNFPDDRRGRREGRNSMEPLRGARDPWDGHERERDRDPRDREQRDRDRDIHERDMRDRDRSRGYDREEPRSSGASIKGRDWETREYTESRREWDGRGRRGAPPEWENSHRAEWGEKDVPLPITHALPHGMPPIEGEWGCFPGPPPGDWPPGDRRGGWVDEWADRPALGGMVPSIGLAGPAPVIAGRQPPRMLPHRDETPLLMLPRDVKEDIPHDDSGKKLHEEVKEKELLLDAKDDKTILEGMKIDESCSKKLGETPESTSSIKRQRDTDSDAEKPEAKKICLDESANLEEDLSDISDDDADEILNREDSVEDLGVGVDGNDVALALSEGPSTPLYHRGTEEHPEVIASSGMIVSETAMPTSAAISEREAAERDESSVMQDGNRDVMDKGILISNQLEDRPQDEETMDNLDFEEISDEELEEEARAGIGDALGVDWASLVAESRPRAKTDATPGSARRRWESQRILARLGVSARYAGWELMEELKSKYSNVKEEKEEVVKAKSTDVKFEQEVKQEIKQEEEQDVKSEETTVGGEEKENQNPKTEEELVPKEQGKSLTFLHPVAIIHVAMKERRERRKALFASSGPYKRALSARRDLAIRRQLCNLPVKETTGDTQQTGPDVELYRLGVQLFERSL